MPTKPVTSYTFSTDLNYSSGPAIGQPTKVAPTGAAQGFVPGDGIEAESPDYMFNINGEWVTDWLIQGTSVADDDAHLVETDSNGRVSASLATFGAHATDGGPSVTMNAPTLGGSALNLTGDGSTFAAIMNNPGGALATLRITHTGTGVCLDCLAVGTDNGAILGTGTGTGTGVTGQGGGTGDGVAGTGGVTSGAGVRGTAGATSATGVIGIGANGASSFGVDGQAGNVGAAGLRGLSDAAATSSGKGVLGTGQGAATGVHGQAVNGYGVVCVSDTTTPTRAALRIAPQDTEPITSAQGDFYVNNTNNLAWIEDNVGFKALHVSLGGWAFGFDDGTGGSHNNNDEHGIGDSGAEYAGATVTTKVTADLIVRGEVTVGGTVGEVITVRLRRGLDETGTIIATRAIIIASSSGSGSSNHVGIVMNDAARPAGANPYQITVERTTGSNIYYTSANTVTAETSS